jgi:hypothetical protein
MTIRIPESGPIVYVLQFLLLYSLAIKSLQCLPLTTGGITVEISDALFSIEIS